MTRDVLSRHRLWNYLLSIYKDKGCLVEGPLNNLKPSSVTLTKVRSIPNAMNMRRFIPRGAVLPKGPQKNAYAMRNRDFLAVQDPLLAITQGNLRPHSGVNIPVPVGMFMQPNAPHCYPPPPQANAKPEQWSTGGRMVQNREQADANMFCSQQSQDPLYMQQIGGISGFSQDISDWTQSQTQRGASQVQGSVADNEVRLLRISKKHWYGNNK
ncbi:unnamed protein product [Gongylonema pulchrum]|uniref:ARID domain-containing protein n=1 Tax=Gongylonema pulchrum TaxID=637853 RepID=A0A183DDS9_9BILA|nr:unnamed protein product [Gongylonema pulchrum]